MNRLQILEAIEALRIRKCRPEREVIANHIAKKYGIQFQEIYSDLEIIVDQGDLIKVEYKGKISYRSPEVFDTKASPLLTKHSKVLNSNRVVRFVLSAVTELLAENDSYTEQGIPVEDIKLKLIEYDPGRFTHDSVTTIIDRELAVGNLVEGPLKRLFPRDLPLPEGAQRNSPSKKMRGRKPAALKCAEIESAATKLDVPPSPDINPSEVFAVKSVPVPVASPTTPVKPVRAYGRKSVTPVTTTDNEEPVPKTEDEKEMPVLLNSAEELTDGKNDDKMPSLSTSEEISTGRSVRNKRKKEVFDPSDLPKKKAVVSTPVIKAEKEKPVSAAKKKADTLPPKIPKKRGRKKKLPEGSSAELADKSKLCVHCESQKYVKGQVETLIKCSVCSKNYHKSCYESMRKRRVFFDKETWQCDFCKLCTKCGQSVLRVDESSSFCTSCDKGFHNTCLDEVEVSEGGRSEKEKWNCSGCKQEESDDNKIVQPAEEVKLEEKAKEEAPVEVKMETTAFPPEQVPTAVAPAKKKPPAKVGRPPKKRIITLNLDKKEDKKSSIPSEISPLLTVTISPPLSEPGKEEAKADEDDDIPSDASKWTPSQVEAYFKKHGLREEGALFREQEIDGLSLLLMTRQHILNGMKLLLGPGLKVAKLVVKLQQSGGVVDDEDLKV